MTLGAASVNVPSSLARCVGRVFVTRPGAENLVLAVGNRKPTAAQAAQLRRISLATGTACRADDNAGLR